MLAAQILEEPKAGEVTTHLNECSLCDDAFLEILVDRDSYLAVNPPQARAASLIQSVAQENTSFFRRIANFIFPEHQAG